MARQRTRKLHVMAKSFLKKGKRARLSRDKADTLQRRIIESLDAQDRALSGQDDAARKLFNFKADKIMESKLPAAWFIRMDSILREAITFWARITKLADPDLTMREAIMVRLLMCEAHRDAVRYVNANGETRWKASKKLREDLEAEASWERANNEALDDDGNNDNDDNCEGDLNRSRRIHPLKGPRLITVNGNRVEGDQLLCGKVPSSPPDLA